MMDMLDLQLCMYEQQQAAAARAMYSFLLVHSLLQSFELVDLGEKMDEERSFLSYNIIGME